VTDYRHTLRKKRLREAEGYLELIMVFADAFETQPAIRDRLARRVLNVLLGLDEPDRQHPQALYLQGQALRSLERYEEAVEPLRQSADQQPENIHVRLALGWCYKRTGRLDLAIEAVEEALAVDPREALLHYNLACYWSLSGNAEAAISCLSRALEIDPGYRDLIGKERDFDPIRKHPSFRELTSVVV
jgi:tetratricopeptide (TPR) repeat protein